MEYWNVDLNKDVTHLLMRLRRINLLVRGNFVNRSLFRELFTHYSITPVFQYSNCERSELS